MHAKLLLLLMGFTLFFSCKSKSNMTQGQKRTTKISFNEEATAFTLTMHIRNPYCKGVAPMPEEEVNGFIPLALKDFALFNNDTFVYEFRTNEQGQAELFLPPGKYGVRHLSKNIDFETFYSRIDKRSNDFVEVGDKECYRKWWQAYEGQFEVNPISNQAVINIESRCFTGEDPCRSYVGPMPP
jgi:hypothetical protein